MEYQNGEWIKETGKYYHICLECLETFTGRRNKEFCSTRCKSKHNNDIRREKDPEAKVRALSYRKTADVLHQCFNHKEKITTLHLHQIIKKGFKLDSPYNRIKFNNQEGEWNQIGSYAYQLTDENQKIIIIKIKQWN
ncbi:hypothetical protein N9P55_01490 [bacterium]|nr:hypothetical protein [bacterium]MDB4089608.1 hypothetical protein [Flavobacteriales bacterium]|tara:strand:- start:405 stop:815 length:411 start_codon:yes stop_codon:yes gene_type:complete